MADTVRNRIIDAIIAAIEAIQVDGEDVVGGLQDATEPVEATASIFAANKLFVQTLFTSETSIDREGQSSGMSLEHVTFDVEIAVHVPESYLSGDTPSGKASRINQLLYSLYRSGPGDAGTWGGLALRTKYVGGAGYSVSAIGSSLMAVEHAFSVEYRFTLGDMETGR